MNPAQTPREKKRLPAPIYQIAKHGREHGKSPEQRRWENYLIPGSHVMRNKLGSSPRSYGINDPRMLDRAETMLSASRMLELWQQPIAGDFDLEHMKAIHHHLFQDVYEWAGQIRNVGLVKNGHAYGRPEQIEARWEKYAGELADQNHLRGITDQHEFTDKLARSWAQINYAHAFREGNTRSQTMFFHQLSREAGWDLSVPRLDPTHPQSVRRQFVEGRFAYQASYNRFGIGDHRHLADVLEQIITPTAEKQREIEAQQQNAAHLIQHRPRTSMDQLKQQVINRGESLNQESSIETGYER